MALYLHIAFRMPCAAAVLQVDGVVPPRGSAAIVSTEFQS
jgi:hypothetical protein